MHNPETSSQPFSVINWIGSSVRNQEITQDQEHKFLMTPFLDGGIQEEISSSSTFCADTRPYALKYDSWIMCPVLFASLVLLYYTRYVYRFLVQEKKKFLKQVSPDNASIHEVKSVAETYAVYVWMFFGAIATSLLFYTYACRTLIKNVSQTSAYFLLLYYFVFILFYFVGKRSLYLTINYIFFDKGKRKVWNESYSFLYFLKTFLLFPFSIVLIFLPISTSFSWTVFLFLLVLIKIILIIKTFSVLFNKFYCLLYFFVYLCALEFIPSFILWMSLNQITNILK